MTKKDYIEIKKRDFIVGAIGGLTTWSILELSNILKLTISPSCIDTGPSGQFICFIIQFVGVICLLLIVIIILLYNLSKKKKVKAKKKLK